MKKRFLRPKRALSVVLLALLLSAAGMTKGYAYDFSTACSSGQTLYSNITDSTNHYVAIPDPRGYPSDPSGIGYDFSAVCSSGQTLYYNITDSINHYVAITPPGGYTGQPWGGGYTQPTGNITLPNSVSYNGITYLVTEIEWTTFYNCTELTGSLTIPNSVIMVDDNAFHNCTGFNGDLHLSNSLTWIGRRAFRNCSGLSGTLIIPSSVTAIGDIAFYGCTGFSSLIIGNSVASIGESAFADCTGFTSITVLSETPPTLPRGAFYNVPQTIPVYVPNGTVSAYQAAEGWSDFTNIQEVGYFDPLTYSINPDGVSVTVTGHMDGNNATGTLTIPATKTINGVTYAVKAIANEAFHGCTGFTGSLTIPNSVTTIGAFAFDACIGFTGTLTIGSSVTSIGNFAFAGDRFTGTLTIGTGVTSIGESAFKGCDRISHLNFNAINCADFSYGDKPFENIGAMLVGGCSLTIGNAVERIPAHIFGNTPSISGSLTIPNSVTSIGSGAFENCYNLTGSLTIPNSVKTIGTDAFYGCENFNGSLTLGNSLTTIGEEAFEGCSGFTGSLTIPNSVTYLNLNAFRDCTGFDGTLILGNSLVEIDEGAFFNCSGFLGELTIPNSVTTIGVSAFEGCSGFTGSLTIGNDVSNIGSYAFEGCSGFDGDLTLGNSVTSIGNYAFRNCHFYSIRVRPLTPPALSSNTFYNMSALTPIYVYCASLEDYQSAPVWSSFNNIQCFNYDFSAECPTGQTLYYTITDAANRYVMMTYPGISTVTPWGGYTQPTGNITLPSTVTHDGITYTVKAIDDFTFSYCTGLTGSLIIPNNVTTIGENAFQFCTGFTGSLVLPNSLTTIGSGAFITCNHFTGDLTIGNSVTSIGYRAFMSCSSFNGTLTIGSAVTTIDYEAFGICSNLSSMVALPETPPILGTDVFGNVPANIPVYVPCASLEEYQAASDWSRFTNLQCIPETLTVFDGTVTNGRIPAYIYYFDDFARSQFVMPADYLAGMTGAPITSMTFYTTISNVPYTTVSPADVYLMEVDYTTISAYEPKASATIVYSGTFDIVSAGSGGEMTINFSTPYIYQGGNLLVGIDNTEDNGWRQIYFYGQTVSGASISGSNGSSMEDIPATQQNFIPSTTFGFTPSMCEPRSLPYTYGFEEEDEFNCWTMLHSHNYTGRSQDARHSGNYGFRFYYNTNPPQYLISPEFKGTEAMDVSFYYKNQSNSYPETFQVGFSTTTKLPDAFTWSAEVTAQNSSAWMFYEDFFPEGTKYVAVKLNSYDKYYLILDDFSFTIHEPCPTPSHVTFTDISYTQATVNWVDYGDTYIALYKAPYQLIGFETGDLGGWTSEGASTWTVGIGDANTSNSIGTHSGFYNAKITHTASGSETWLVSPMMDLSDLNTAHVDFWFTNREWSPDTDELGLYYRIDGGPWQELWSVTDAHESWTRSSVYLANLADNYQIGFKFTDHYGYGVALDDISIVYDDNMVGSIVSTHNVAYPNQSYTFTGLEPHCTYIVQMRAYCDGIGSPQWTEHIPFTTATPTAPTFLTNGNWNDAVHWSTDMVPAEGSDVLIAANAIVPAGYTAVVNVVSLEGGSITVADGGQLKHNTPGLVVTMKKIIEAYTDVNSRGDYYLLAFPFYDSSQVPVSFSSQVPASITGDEGCDFFRYDSYYFDAEWRNHKETPIETVEMREGYLYANSESIELSLTGGTVSAADESMTDRMVMVFSSNFPTDDPRQGWELLGNPFTYNAYVYRQGNNGELVPMPIMIYDADGNPQTIYCGPVPPLQGFFVHVTGSTTVCFRGTMLHENDYVDLGLPSGTLWATCNVGASSPEEYGDYFAWGEIQPKDTYNWSTYIYGSVWNQLTKYCNQSVYGYEGFTDNLTTLLPEDDVATTNWGSGWRMPTREEWQELYNNTTVIWTQQNGVNGHLFTANNGNSIFMPAAGIRDENSPYSLYNAGSYGYFWSSSFSMDNPSLAWRFYFNSDGCGMYQEVRYSGLSVRPVRSTNR